jgi:hypothetical protein
MLAPAADKFGTPECIHFSDGINALTKVFTAKQGREDLLPLSFAIIKAAPNTINAQKVSKIPHRREGSLG